MRTLIKFTALLFFISFIGLSCKKNKNDNECTLDCKNGGTCSDNSCNCTGDWSGPSCETFFTETYAGEYVSTNFDCGAGPTALTSQVSVDPGNKNRLTIGSLFADMTDRTHFTIVKQGSANFTGFGTIDGKTMTLMYTGQIFTITTTCNGTFTKK